MMRREDYKAVKHMDKVQLEKYLERIYQRGFDAAVKAMAAQMANGKPEATSDTSEV